MTEAPDSGSADGADRRNRVDPWSVQSNGRARFFAFSTVIHIALLVLLATLSITVVREIERVDVTFVEKKAVVDHLDLFGSPDDFAGLLNVAPAPRREAERTKGPRVRDVQAPDMPKLGGVGPKLGAPNTGESVVSGTHLSLGSGGVGGLGGGFGEYVGGLRRIGLDLVLVIDSTESMEFVIDQVKERAASLVASIQAMVPTSRIGIVVYRDRGDDYVTRSVDLSFRTEKLLAFVAEIAAEGGGDYPEAVLAAIEKAVQGSSWRKKSKKIVILIGGSPPHGEDVDRLRQLVRRFQQDGGTLSAIDVTDALHSRFSRWMWEARHPTKPFEPSDKPEHYERVTEIYRELSEHGGGELIELEDDRRLIRDVLVLTFGKRWELELDKYVEEFS